jgi:hypothetical protein
MSGMTKRGFMAEEYKMTNREKVRKPRLGKGYCRSCDRCQVGFGSRCKICGTRDDHKNFKK